MKKIVARRRPAKKKRKSSKIKAWIAIAKGDYLNCCVDTYGNIKEKLAEMGYTIVGYPVFAKKDDAVDYAIEYIRQTTGKKYRREPKKCQK